MLSGYASNSILAIIRAKYGKSLTEHDFSEMANFHSVGEIASFLATRTKYSVALDSLNMETVNRASLEHSLRNYLFLEMYNVCTFEKSVGNHMFTCIMKRYEIFDFLNFLRLLIAGNPEKFIFRDNKKSNVSSVDFDMLISARDYDDILECIKDNDIKMILSATRPASFSEIDFTMIESILMNYLYGFERKIIQTEFTGKTEKELLSILDIRADMANINKIYRVKRFFSVSSEMLSSELIESCGRMSIERRRRMVAAESSDDVAKILKESAYGRYFNINSSDIERTTAVILNDYYRRRIRMSSSPAVVMMCYHGLMDNEISNITSVIEGVRYSSSPEYISKLLILSKGGVG